MENQEKVLYLRPLKLTGPENMAIDLFLLEKSFSKNSFHMALRFYTWDGDWLSIGKNQKKIPEVWLELLKKKQINIVRRPSGGNAVLHSKGMTYALIWKDPPRNKKESYRKTTQWLKDGFKKAGVELFYGGEAARTSTSNCFATSTLADLVDKDKNKYVGSAQYWKKGHLLQHGEILMEPSRKLWNIVFENDPPKINGEIKERDKIISFLKESFIKTWPNLIWYDYKLNSNEQEKIKRLSNFDFKEINHF